MVFGNSDYLLVIGVPDLADHDRFVRDVLVREPNMLKYRTRFCMSCVRYSTKLQTAASQGH